MRGGLRREKRRGGGPAAILARRYELGRRGERRAARYLRLRGWRVLARNWRQRAARHGGWELDLVVRRAGVLAFVEVKTRSGEIWEMVSPKQQKRIEYAAAAWLLEHGGRFRDLELRFDLVRVEGRRITHLADAWRLGDAQGGSSRLI